MRACYSLSGFYLGQLELHVSLVCVHCQFNEKAGACMKIGHAKFNYEAHSYRNPILEQAI